MMNGLPRLLYSDNTILTTGDRATHTYVIGQPGTGKSRAIESWVMQDITAGQGVGVIDPHGELFQNLVIRLSNFPKVWHRIVIIDPCNPKWVTTFNPLGAINGISEERLSLFLTDIVSKIWKLDLADAPRTMWLLTNSFLALSNLSLNLLDLPRFLLDKDFRESLLPRLTHFGARTYFLDEFPKGPSAAHQWATPVLNKIGNLLFDPDTSLILAGESRITFRNILDRKLILLVNLPKGIIGEGASALLGAFIVAHIQKAALARTDTVFRPPFYLYLDEFQNYTTDNVIDILSESRKYALSLTLVHQYLDQLSNNMRSAVLNTAGSLCCFRVGHQDGYQLAKDIFPSPNFLERFEDRLNLGRRRFGFAIGLRGHQDFSGWESLAQALSNLPPREFWFRRRGPTTPAKHRTFDMPIPGITADIRERIQAMLDASGTLYSRLKVEVQNQALKHQNNNLGNTQRTEAKPQGPEIDESPTFWGV
jgi:hypothetical protein